MVIKYNKQKFAQKKILYVLVNALMDGMDIIVNIDIVRILKNKLVEN